MFKKVSVLVSLLFAVSCAALIAPRLAYTATALTAVAEDAPYETADTPDIAADLCPTLDMATPYPTGGTLQLSFRAERFAPN